MQYVVRVSGEVLAEQNKVYVVESKTIEEAQDVAAQNFCDDFTVKSDSLCVKLNKRTHKAIAALIIMLIPIVLSFIEWKDGHNTVLIRPDYTSCLYGVLLYAAFVVRFKGIQKTVSSWIDILFCVFTVLLLSTFARTLLVTKTIRFLIFFKISIDTNMILMVSIILSWLGLKIVSLVCMGGVTIFALFNMADLSAAMGAFWGPLYILCSFIGILMYLSVEPACDEALLQMKYAARNGLKHLSGDVSYAKTKIINTKKQHQKEIPHQMKNEE